MYSFQGTGTDIFTLQLSFTATSPDSYLGWLSGDQWVNAVDGNTGNNATLEAFEPMLRRVTATPKNTIYRRKDAA